MAMVRHFICVFLLVSVSQGVLAAAQNGDISDVLNELRQRIELLEARDAAKDARIAELESEISDLKLKMEDMETTNRHNEERLLGRIDTLEMTITQSTDDVTHVQQPEREDNVASETTQGGIKRQMTKFRKDRDIPETEVAFYATHSTNKIHHLGANQALLFQYAVTNNGNAYNNNTGAFVAPVDGTYVFHATVMAIDTTSHFRAHFDVDGVSYSVFRVTSYDQSSQMLVINLKPGQTVTIRNDLVDTGFYGDHHSTFSGFLLYQNYPPSGAIVGK